MGKVYFSLKFATGTAWLALINQLTHAYGIDAFELDPYYVDIMVASFKTEQTDFTPFANLRKDGVIRSYEVDGTSSIESH